MTFVSDTSRAREGLKKTGYTDGRVLSADASSMISMSRGAVDVYMSLPESVVSGVYSKCDGNKYFTDYLIFAVNPVGHFISPPGMYAALTPSGIEFTIWTSAGQVTVLDTVTNISPDTPFMASFCWDWAGTSLGGGAKVAIFVNGTHAASTNSTLASDDLSDLELTFLDNHQIDYGTECELFDIITYSSVPLYLQSSIPFVTKKDFGDDYVAMTYGDSVRIISTTTGADHLFVNNVGTISSGPRSLAVSDSDMGLYVMSVIDDGLGSSSVSYVNSSTGLAGNRLVGLMAPVSIGVTQLGGMEYPRTSSTDLCRTVWVCESDEVITASSALVETGRRGGYVGISSVIPISDGRAWVLDRDGSAAHLLSADLSSEDVTISIPSPEFGGASIFNDLYVYDSATERVVKYTDGIAVNSASVGPDAISMDVRAVDGYVAVSFSDGSVRVFNGIMEEQYVWTYGSSATSVIFRRGYGRNTLYVLDDLLGILREMTIWGSYVTEYYVGTGAFMGSSVSLANNNAAVYSEIPVDAEYDTPDGTISNVEFVHYKVDSVPVDLTGGGDNEVHYRKDGTDRGSIPMDLRKNTVKGARIAE